MKILLGITGSVAAKLTNKLVTALKEQNHHVTLVATKSALNFIDQTKLFPLLDQHEWDTYTTNNTVLHIDLAKQHDLLLIAPCTANTLSKIKFGLCDNLLTNIVMCWDRKKPFVVAPAMNCEMYKNGKFSMLAFDCPYLNVVSPQSKKLFCGDVGIGAMAEISDIVNSVNYYN